MTLYTSDTKKITKVAFIYLLLSIFCALFGAVYEYFSYGVYSYYMIYAFAIPLVGGVLPALSCSLLGIKKHPGSVARNLYHCGIATFTVGSIIQGVLEIYGTTNNLIQWYWLVGIALVTIAVLVYLGQLIWTLLRKTSSSDNAPLN